MLESDIRARLGRLPKGLTGVYDEILTSIKSQPNRNLDLAKSALKWMLVSERPLKPKGLVAAALLNPSIPPDSPAPLKESALPVELLIQSCAGLLLLDTTLDVVRFSHLSVQEYLETRNDIWDVTITDAQLFVSESCLWTLQSTLELPLYEYAALNWFKHCRSYQNLVLAVVNTRDITHELSIPLLNSFLGSFEQASTRYSRWADWVGINVSEYDSNCLYCIRSTPLCPVFSAAFAGLGELLSWLWNSEGYDMKVNNDSGDSLLAVASEHGTAWIVAKMLEGGFQVSDLQYPLICATVESRYKKPPI